MNAVQYEFFDDLLIGNFMKTTIHGAWGNGPSSDCSLPAFHTLGDALCRQWGAKTLQQLDEYFAGVSKNGRLSDAFSIVSGMRALRNYGLLSSRVQRRLGADCVLSPRNASLEVFDILAF